MPTDAFVNLSEATIRSAVSFHRLDHLGRHDAFRFKEETITDLLVGYLAGTDYEVSAQCPACETGQVACADWTGSAGTARREARIRALTKFEEGGNSRTGRTGLHSDFILAMKRPQPLERHADEPTELRLLIQAKRVQPGARFLSRKESKQYELLLAAAAEARALPYYALYVQQPDAHSSSPTRCPVQVTAADRSIVLVAAPALDSGNALPGRRTDEVIADGRPLRCLAGCRCLHAGSTEPGWAAFTNFVAADFPDSPPVDPATPLPPGVPAVRTDPAVRKAAPSRRADGPAQPEVLLVRLGPAQAAEDESGRAYLGYSPDFDAEQLRDAARMYWVISQRRAENVRYLVAAAGSSPLACYQVVEGGVQFHLTDNGRYRAKFEVIDVADKDLAARLRAAASRALTAGRPTLRNPVRYLSL